MYIKVGLLMTPEGFPVSDNGIAINPSHFKDIFIPFVCVSGQANYPGSGMVLAICKKIVDRHKRKIWVESIPDHGSTFFFTLPVLGAE